MINGEECKADADSRVPPSCPLKASTHGSDLSLFVPQGRGGKAAPALHGKSMTEMLV
jgi:hypothetical protein